jgi:predicted small lipoprotein YifL
MRRLSRSALAAVLLALLAACGGGGDDEDEPRPTPPLNCEQNREVCR